jgi:UDP-3-O-[3-hydroxymyristoyl] N-acetylglucosamine deacetylase
MAAVARRLIRAVTVTGIGLHSGSKVRVKLLPAPTPGITFVRVDAATSPEYAAHVDSVVSTQLCTRLGVAGCGADGGVSTVEHLLAAFAWLGVQNCRVEVDGPELPILDGSAVLWVQRIAGSLVEDKDASRARPLALAAPIELAAGDATISARPAEQLSFAYSLDFADAAIGAQTADWTPHADAGAAAIQFATHVAPARTFTTDAAAGALLASGRTHGGSLANALVTDGAGGWRNGPLRFANEPARHKLLDLLGDLALAGRPLGAMRIEAHRAGHELHVELARALLRADAAAS